MNEDTGNKAFELHKKITQNEAQRRELFTRNLLNLAEMHNKGLYKAYLGDEEAEWSGYLSEIEVFYTRNQVKDYLRIHKKFVEELGLSTDSFIHIPKGRLIDLIPIVTADNFQEWYYKAVVLTTKDWKIEIRKAKGVISEEDEHEHDYKTYDICRICGEKHVKRNEEDTTEA